MQKIDDPIIKSGLWTFLFTFPLKEISKVLTKAGSDSQDSKETIIHRLEKLSGIKNKWTLSHDEKHFSDTEKFFLPDEVRERWFRMRLEGFSVHWPQTSRIAKTNPTSKVEVFLTIYDDFDMGVLLFQLTPQNCTTDDLIFLKQNFTRPREIDMKIEGPEFIFKNSGKASIASIYEMVEEYIFSVRDAFHTRLRKYDSVKTNMFEIRELDGIDNPEDFYTHYPNHVYGLMLGDEGYRYVPKELAEERIQKSWSSRNFFKIIALDKTVLSLNFIHGSMYSDYTKQIGRAHV